MYTAAFGTHPGKKSSKYLNNTAAVKNCLASYGDCLSGNRDRCQQGFRKRDTQVQLQINKHKLPGLGVQAARAIRNKKTNIRMYIRQFNPNFSYLDLLIFLPGSSSPYFRDGESTDNHMWPTYLEQKDSEAQRVSVLGPVRVTKSPPRALITTATRS